MNEKWARPLFATLVVAAVLVQGAAATRAQADPLTIEKDGTVKLEKALEVGTNGSGINDKGATIQGFNGRNVFQDVEKAGALRVGAFGGIPGIYSEKGDIIVGSQSGKIQLKGTVEAGTIDAGTINVDKKNLTLLIADLNNKIGELEKQIIDLQRSVVKSTDGSPVRVVRGTIKGYPGRSIAAGDGFLLENVNTAGVFDITFKPAFIGIPTATVTQVFNGENEYNFRKADQKGTAGGVGGSTLNNAVIVYLSAEGMRITTGNKDGEKYDRHFSFMVIGPR